MNNIWALWAGILCVKHVILFFKEKAIWYHTVWENNADCPYVLSMTVALGKLRLMIKEGVEMIFFLLSSSCGPFTEQTQTVCLGE